MEQVGIAGRSRWTMGVCWLVPALFGCGSGDLGKIVEAQTVAPPPQMPMMPSGGMEPADAGAADGVCGDGIAQPARGEQCDNADFRGHSCADLGFGTGVLSCDPVTCHLIVAQCGRTGAPRPAPDTGTMNQGVDAGISVADAATTMPECPGSFLCQTSPYQSGEFVCAQWGEESPLCLDPATDTDCAALLPGSKCTDTGLGYYCILACGP